MAPRLKKLEIELFAPSTPGKDPMLGYSQSLAISEDKIFLAKGGGRFDIYKELLRDEQVRSCFQQRQLALIGKDWDVVSGEEGNAVAEQAAEELKTQLKALKWDTTASLMLYGVFYGFAVGEMEWEFKESRWWMRAVHVIDCRRFAWGVNNELFLYTRKAPQGELLQTHFDARAQLAPFQNENPAHGKFWAFSTGADNSHSPYGLGLANAIYWHVFFKHQNVRFWLKFLERFASPTPAAKAPPKMIEDKAERKKILDTLAAIVNDAGVIIPDWLEVTLLEAKRSGTVDYDKLRETADRAIAKLILGQTMTTEQEGGQYKADVAKDVRDEIIQADADLLANSFNAGPAAWWTIANFGEGVAAPLLKWNVAPEEDKVERADRDNKIADLGFEPSEEYIEETYGPGWTKKAAPPPAPPALQPPPGAGPLFAEPGARAAILDSLAGHAGDQGRIKDAAAHMGREFRALVGDRVDELIAYAEETDDLATFRRKLVEMMAEQPSPAVVDRLQRQGFASRMAGLFRSNKE